MSGKSSFKYIAALCISFGLAVANAGESHIVADPTAPGRNQPQVVGTGNGLPQVNISTPNSNGLSYNRYNRFDVGSGGAILNNSNKNVQTQLGGWIEKNPNLAGGAANLIVNEVNSSRPSQINGFIEIAGQRADVVIANGSGISVDGGGFINANRATLTTGIPVIQNGSLTGFEVRGGQIDILGDGLNNRNVTFTDIIAHSVNVNAKLHAAQQLNIVAGENFVSKDVAQITRLNPDAETGVSIDVKALGGMYANEIRLVGTGRGVGVNSGMRNEGNIFAQVGEVVIDQDGMLSSSGVISGQGGVNIGVDDEIVNTGVMQSGGDFSLESSKSFLNDNGEIIVLGDTSILAQQNVTNTGIMELQGDAVIAGVDGVFDNSGRINTGGDSEIFADRDILNTGSLESAGDLRIVTQSGSLTANEDSVFLSGGAMYLGAKGDITNAGKLQSNSGGLTLVSTDGTIRNTQRGSIRASGDAVLSAALNFINAGTIHAEGRLEIESRGGTFGNSGLLSATLDSVFLSKKDIANLGTILIDRDLLTRTGENFTNEGRLSIGGTFRLDAAKGALNSGEMLGENHYLTSDTFFNTGLVDGAGEVIILASTAFTNVDTGTIFGDHIAIESKSIRNGVLPENDTGHTPMTNTVYDEETGQYVYKEDGNQEYEDISEDFDWEEASKYDPDVEFGEGEDYDEWIPEEGEDPESGGEVVSEEEVLPETEDHTYEEDKSRGTTTGNAGVIAARDRLDLAFADSLVNNEDGLLLSGGDMYIGGQLDGEYHAAGKGGTLLNSSATIEAGNDLTANLEELTNLNAYYRTEERLIHSGNYTGYRFSQQGDSKIYIAGIDQIKKGTTKRGAWMITVPYKAEDFFQYSIHREVYDQFVVESRPGYLTAGGKMTITGNVTNNRSIMTAGDTLTINGDLTNIEAREAAVTRDSGSVQWTWVASAGTFGSKHKREYSSAGAYNPAPVYDWSVVDVERFGIPDNFEITASALDGTGDLTFAPKLQLPPLNNNMYSVNRNPDTGYVVETNPRFSDYRTWLSSDFMVERLASDPQNVLKRLGDGYYEQKMIRDQIANMTGSRYLSGFTSDEEQYRALMLAGVEFAEEMKLEIGVMLTAEQMAQLTSDIVWLEYVTVDSPDGPVQALAPVVYLAPGREVLMTAGGGIVSGREVEITGELKNAGSILGTDSVSISGTDIANSGAITGGLVSMAALRDIDNIGGTIVGQTGVELSAGRDITIESSTYTTSTQNGNQSSSRTEIAGQAGVFVTDEEGSLSMRAGNDINLTAADVESEGSMRIAAGNDLNIGGVTVSFEHETGVKGDNYLHDRESMDVGSVLYSAKDMELSAGKGISVTGSSVLGDGAIDMQAGGDVSITEGRAQEFHETTSLAESKGFLSKKTEKTHELMDDDYAIGSEISGNTVNIVSGGDFSLRGSTVAASEGLNVTATGDIDISGAENSSDYAYAEEMKKTGFSASFSGTGVGVSYGTTKTSDKSADHERTITGSLIGSETGDVSLYAGKDVGIAGSQVVAGTGDVAISGENVTIENQYENYDHNERHTFEQSGISLSLGLTGPVASAVEAGMQAADTLGRAQNAGTGRAQALYGIAAARQGYDAAKAVGQIAQNPGSAANIGLSVNLGFSSTKNESTYQSHDQVAVGSQITSGGDTTIVARGREGEAGTGDLSIIGSQVMADGKVTLAAADDLNLLSAEENSSFSNSNENSSSGFGVGVNLGTGLGFTANAHMNSGSGEGHGRGTSHAETIISGGEGVEFSSGNDTTLKGAQIIGEGVVGNVGGDLSIISEQDTYSELQKNSSKGGGASIGFGTGLSSIGGNYNTQKQEGESDYASVDEQTGIYAGDDGFDITVGDNTHLKGGVIASDADSEKNNLTTGSITTEDIYNHSEYGATTKGSGGEFTYVKNPSTDDKNANTGSISPSLPMEDKGDDSSTTHAAVEDGTITITDEEAQLAETGQTVEEAVESVDRDTENAHEGALDKNPDLQELLDQQSELADAAAQAGRAVAQTVGDISQSMYEKTGDPGWKEGGIYKVALETVGAALVSQLGNGDALNAALGTLASQLLSNNIHDFSNTIASLVSSDSSFNELLGNIIGNLLSGGIGAAVGGETGQSSASTSDKYNWQEHRNIAEKREILEGLKELINVNNNLRAC